MSTHNLCFGGEIRKILYGDPHLSGAMGEAVSFIFLFLGENKLWLMSYICQAK